MIEKYRFSAGSNKMCFSEEVENDMDDELEDEDKELIANKTKKLIKYLKDNRASNADARADFAKTIFELALSSDPVARKFIRKLSQFCAYWGDDDSISEDEWKKLNNSEE